MASQGNPRVSRQGFVIVILIIAVLVGGLGLAALENVKANSTWSLHLGKAKDNDAGPLLFGGVIGWVTYRTLRRDGPHAHISDIASVVGAVGGTTVTGLVDKPAIGWYMVGLFAGFFLFYLVHSILAEDNDKKTELLIGENSSTTQNKK